MQTFKLIVNDTVHRFKVKEISAEVLATEIINIINEHHNGNVVDVGQLYNAFYSNTIKLKLDVVPDDFKRVMIIKCNECETITFGTITHSGTECDSDNFDKYCPECNNYWKKVGRLNENEILFSFYMC